MEQEDTLMHYLTKCTDIYYGLSRKELRVGAVKLERIYSGWTQKGEAGKD